MNSRTLIKHNNKILLCHMKKDNFYFLPGGHIKSCETAIDCIYREFKEEMNIDKNDIKIKKFLGLLEFDFNGKYGRDPVSEVELNNYDNVKSVENHIDFVWVDINNIDNIDFRPISMKKIINGETGYIL